MSGYNGRNRPVANGGPPGVQRSFASSLKEQEPLFNSYEHLQGLPRGDAALTMLRKVASLVKPIMRKRGWKVQVLAEFLPPEANLLGLNINRGFKICIRLRYHNNPDLFLPLEQVVDTMLHELSHNVHGPHDSKFHRLWDELRDEWETLTRKGYTGEGFLSEGKRVGGGRAPPPPHEMRRLARASAEKRQAQNKLTKGSGQRLGGTPLHLTGGDVRQVIADQVTRRNTISKGCGSGRNDAVTLSDQSAGNSFRTKAEEDDANNRAIMQALYELIEEEEARKLLGTFSTAPTDGGLAWHPETGLYDPRTELLPELHGNNHPQPSEDDLLKRALQESMQGSSSIAHSTTRGKQPTRPNPLGLDRSNTIPRARSDSKPSPVSATQQDSITFSPVSPLTPETEPPRPKRKPLKQSSLSTTTTIDLTQGAEADTTDTITSSPHPSTTRTSSLPTPTPSESAFSPILGVDISPPFDPTAAPPDEWTCDICTCINPLQFLACDACGTERPERVGIGNRGARPRPQSPYSPSAPSSFGAVLGSQAHGPAQGETGSLGWCCSGCGAFMEHRWWTCSACGRMKESS